MKQSRKKLRIQPLIFLASCFIFMILIKVFVSEVQGKNLTEKQGTFDVTGQVSSSADTSASDFSDISESGADGSKTKGNTLLANQENEWMLRLVNKDNGIPEGYQPELSLVEDGYYLDSRAADALSQMLSDCRAAGFDPIICSSYRSMEKQTSLYNRQVEKQKAKGYDGDEALVQAATVVQYPGKSEHNLGLAADIVSRGYQILDKQQENTAEQKWLMENCHRYGFVLRYPSHKQEITNVIYEPWHYRYVGEEAAAYLTQNDMCLEELWQEADG